MLYIGENRGLECLPDDMSGLSSLEELDLSDCNIHTLPQSLSECTSLVRLWLSGNK